MRVASLHGGVLGLHPAATLVRVAGVINILVTPSVIGTGVRDI
jgi:hypothetical protein